MRMGFVGRRNEKDSMGREEWEWQSTEWQPRMRMGFAGRRNEKDSTRRGEWE
jgi:hypothetical protein